MYITSKPLLSWSTTRTRPVWPSSTRIQLPLIVSYINTELFKVLPLASKGGVGGSGNGGGCLIVDSSGGLVGTLVVDVTVLGVVVVVVVVFRGVRGRAVVLLAIFSKIASAIIV